MKRDLTLFSKRLKYEPWYDDKADYNTNAKSYYDYLARFNKYIHEITDFINQLADRDLNTEETNSIEFVKSFDWQEPDDIIKLLANVKISDVTKTSDTLDNIDPSTFSLGNSINIEENGIWSPDYLPVLLAMNNEIGNLQDKNNGLDEELETVKNELSIVKSGLQKLLDNLHSSGALTSKNMETYSFKSDRDIATGNINLFGGTADGNSFIRTNSGSSNNDITAGY